MCTIFLFFSLRTILSTFLQSILGRGPKSPAENIRVSQQEDQHKDKGQQLRDTVQCVQCVHCAMCDVQYFLLLHYRPGQCDCALGPPAL